MTRDTGSVARSLRVRDGDVVALVGGGGKTSLMRRLASELSDAGKSVIITTTTRIGMNEAAGADHLLIGNTLEDILCRMADVLAAKEGRIIAVGRSIGPDGKLAGIPPEWVDKIAQTAGISNIIVEADGAANQPLKAPAAHEPVIPQSSSIVLAVAGIDVVGKALTKDNVHRPELVSRVVGVPMDSRVTAESVAKVLASPEGGSKGVPSNARLFFVLNKVDTPEDLALARQVAAEVLRLGGQTVLMTTCHGKRPVVEALSVESTNDRHDLQRPNIPCIVLAGGASTRMGKPKLALPVAGKSVLRRTVETAVSSIAEPVIVVLSEETIGLRSDIYDLPVQVVVNQRAKEGQITSLQAGLTATPPDSAAAVFILGDQPFIGKETIDRLIDEYCKTSTPVIGSDFGTYKGVPALLDCSLFAQVMALSGDQGARDIMKSAPDAVYLKVTAARAELDIDTWEDYLEACRHAEQGLGR